MTFSATEAAFEGFRVVRRHPVAVLFWFLAYVAQYAVLFGMFGGVLASLTAAVAESLAGGQSLADVETLSGSSAGLIWFAVAVTLVVSSVLNAAIARAVLRPSDKAFGYLRLGGDELRVLAVSLVLGVVIMATCIVLFGVTGAATGLAASVNPGLGMLVGLLLGTIAAAVVIWLCVRLSLATPITIMERHITPFASFALTKGKTGPLLGMAIVAGIMSVLVSLLLTVVTLPVTLLSGGEAGLAAFAGQSTAQIIQQAWPIALAWVVVNAVQSGLQLPVLYAPFSAAYRDLKGLPHE